MYALGNQMFFADNPFEAVKGRDDLNGLQKIRSLLEEGKRDGSIETKYIKELSGLLPLINFWLMPSVFPAAEEELLHKYRFVIEMLDHMGLPLYDDDTMSFTEKFITDITETPCGHKAD